MHGSLDGNLHRTFHWTISGTIAWLLCVPNCWAYEIVLPEVGSDVNHDYSLNRPVFNVTSGAPAEDVIQSEATFAQGKHLRIIPLLEPLFVVELKLRADGIADVFEPIFNTFNETLSLLRQDGSKIASTNNVSIGYYQDDRSQYEFGWDFHELTEHSIYGLRWNITPDFAEGKEFPEFLTVEIKFFTSGPIIVAPEATSIVILVTGLAGLALNYRYTNRQQRRRDIKES